MADTSSGTPEAIALALLEAIANTERWNQGQGAWKKSRAHIFDTYRQCLRVAKDSAWKDIEPAE